MMGKTKLLNVLVPLYQTGLPESKHDCFMQGVTVGMKAAKVYEDKVGYVPQPDELGICLMDPKNDTTKPNKDTDIVRCAFYPAAKVEESGMTTENFRGNNLQITTLRDKSDEFDLSRQEEVLYLIRAGQRVAAWLSANGMSIQTPLEDLRAQFSSKGTHEEHPDKDAYWLVLRLPDDKLKRKAT